MQISCDLGTKDFGRRVLARVSSVQRGVVFRRDKTHPGSLLSTGENGVAAASGRRGRSPEGATTTPSTTPSVTPSKRPETASRGSNGEEAFSVPTPSRSFGKARQSIDIKAELEKRQGGKPLLNLVVIGRKKIHKATYEFKFDCSQ